MTINRQATCARRRKTGTAVLSALAALALAGALAAGNGAPAYAIGSSAETEIGVMFIEEPQVGGQDGDPANPDSSQGSQQGNQEGLPQKGVAEGLLAGGEGASSWLLTTGDAMGKASGALAFVAAAAALACLAAAHRIGKEARHAR